MASSAAELARRRASKRLSIGRSISPMARTIAARSSGSISPMTPARCSAAPAGAAASEALSAAVAATASRSLHPRVTRLNRPGFQMAYQNYSGTWLQTSAAPNSWPGGANGTGGNDEFYSPGITTLYGQGGDDYYWLTGPGQQIVENA